MRARFGYYVGIVCAAAGLGLARGWGWGLVAFGIGVAASFVWLYDVAEPVEPEPSDVRTREEPW
jgi:hypothetical protein